MSAVPANAFTMLTFLASNPINARTKQSDLVKQALDLTKAYENATGSMDWSAYTPSQGLINAGGQGAQTSIAPTVVVETANNAFIGAT